MPSIFKGYHTCIYVFFVVYNTARSRDYLSADLIGDHMQCMPQERDPFGTSPAVFLGGEGAPYEGPPLLGGTCTMYAQGPNTASLNHHIVNTHDNGLHLCQLFTIKIYVHVHVHTIYMSTRKKTLPGKYSMYSAQYEERELVTISVFSHFLGH